MSTSREQRSLVVVSHLAEGPFDVVYQGIQHSGRLVLAGTQLAYGRGVELYDGKATVEKFLRALRTEAAVPAVREIDVVVMLHGLPNVLVFADDDIKMSALRDAIADLGVGEKLRLLYSTACYGLTHADEFVTAGFTAAVGARRVNANAAPEFPVLLGAWVAGRPLKDAVAAGQAGRKEVDELIAGIGRMTGKFWADDVDSTKGIVGNRTITVTTSNG